MSAHHTRGIKQDRCARQHALRVVRMEAYLLPFGATQWRGLVPDASPDAYPSDVMQECGEQQLLCLRLGYMQLARCAFGQPRYSGGVTGEKVRLQICHVA